MGEEYISIYLAHSDYLYRNMALKIVARSSLLVWYSEAFYGFISIHNNYCLVA